MKVLENLKYNKDHEWVKVEGKTAYFGITDYAQDSLGGIVYVELPEVDDACDAGKNFITIESVKAATDILAPFDCKVLEVNETLEDSPESINETPYDSWLVKLEILDEKALDDFMNAADYEAFCEEEA
jgi:glycine cleavage system H protein